MPRQKVGHFSKLAIASAPAVFVLLWSTGFIGAKFGLPYAEPLTFLALRFALVCPLLAAVALAVRAPWPRGAVFWHNVVSGLLLHGVYLSGVFNAIDRGMPAGIAALMVGLQPLLTSTVANRWLGEPVRLQQWIGLVLGVVGVYFVVHGKVGDGEASLAAWAAISVALLGVTVGTIYQKKFAGGGDLRSNMPVQYGAAVMFCGAGAFLFETQAIEWSVEFIFALAWLTIILSWGAIYLFYVMIRRTEATRLVSLFYLVPPVTAVMSYFLFGETLDMLAIAGMGVCILGVLLVNWNGTVVRA